MPRANQKEEGEYNRTINESITEQNEGENEKSERKILFTNNLVIIYFK